MIDERRQYHRYTGPSEALAVLKPHPIKLGQIVNISEGGLAFQYMSDDKIETKYIELDIFISAKGQQYNAFPFTTIRRISIYDNQGFQSFKQFRKFNAKTTTLS